jgi:hypothetical protein
MAFVANRFEYMPEFRYGGLLRFRNSEERSSVLGRHGVDRGRRKTKSESLSDLFYRDEDPSKIFDIYTFSLLRLLCDNRN